MATPTVTARLVPTPVARDLGDPSGTATPGASADLAAVVAGVTGVDSVEVVGGSEDGGTTPGDGVVHLLITIEGEATVGAAETIIDNVLALDTDDVYDDGGSELVLTYAPGAVDEVEADPTLAVTSHDNPPFPTITEDGDDRVSILVDPTLTGSNKVTSKTVTTTELDNASIPVAIRGLPDGHESQKVSYPTGRTILKVGPAPDSSAEEYDFQVAVTDGNGRTSSTLTSQVYVSAGAGPSLDSDDADDALSQAEDDAATTTVVTATVDNPVSLEVTSDDGFVAAGGSLTITDNDDFTIASGTHTFDLDIDAQSEDIDGSYDIVVTATDGLGNTDTYTLALTITDPA